jgi:hypothetical protein
LAVAVTCDIPGDEAKKVALAVLPEEPPVRWSTWSNEEIGSVQV